MSIKTKLVKNSDGTAFIMWNYNGEWIKEYTYNTMAYAVETMLNTNWQIFFNLRLARELGVDEQLDKRMNSDNDFYDWFIWNDCPVISLIN